MNFCWCTITVNNLEQSVKFYQEILGLRVERQFSPNPGMEIAFLTDESGMEIELIKFADRTVTEEKKGISLGFTVKSLEDAMAMVKENGIAVIGQPVITPMVKYFFIKDPNGVNLQLVEKVKE
ncbi:MAG: hypothetical protein BGN88_11210 [Clostridiales bacterium 43-6]|nr:MAG: hypothetical protein BGN88_11210 [Clostridiales bacterium 43-6]